MRRLTSPAADALRELEAPRPLLRLLDRPIETAVIDKLGRIGDPVAAPALVALLIGSDRRTFDRIASVIAGLMGGVAPDALPELGETCRALGEYDVVDWSAWRALTAKNVRRLATSRGGESVHTLGVASFHRSGYVREAAVASLDGVTTGAELPYLIVRMNDWVTPVADAARAAVVRRVDDPWVTEWVRSLSLVSHMRSATRRAHDEVIQRVFGFLREPRHGHVLREGFRSDDRIARRLAFTLARGSAAFPVVELVRIALLDHDTVIRVEAIREALPVLDDDSFLTLLDTIDANPSMPVRRAGLLAAAERFPKQVTARAERALMDRNAAVRELARFQLKQGDPSRSFAATYRDEISKATTAIHLATALAGLGETGERADAWAVESHARHERPSVRRAAIRTLGRLDAASYGPIFVEALRDRSPRVTHEAREALAANPSLIDLETLRRLVHDAPTLAGRFAALILARRLGRWMSLTLWLEASMMAELDVAEYARQQLDTWLRRGQRSFVAPPASALAELDALLARARFSIDDRIRREIAGVLDSWR